MTTLTEEGQNRLGESSTNNGPYGFGELEESSTNSPSDLASTIPVLSSDISEWFKTDEDIKIFSDYEGTTTTRQIQNVKKIFEPDNKEKCIYLGDIFDNANFNDKTFEEYYLEPELKKRKSKCIKTQNYCALTMLKLFVDNPDKCRYVVGNRDINKLKLFPLLQFANGEAWWKNGNSYEEIIKNLLQNTKPKSTNPFLINSMEYYIPFWKGDLKNDEKCSTKNKDKTIKDLVNWTTPKQLTIGTLYDRYNKIFGTDCSKGTMSADYTSMGLPNELFKDAEGDNTIDKMIERLQNKLISPYMNIRPAIVFTVFMRMLDKDLWEENKGKDKKIHELGALDGYLYQYLSRAYPSFYAIKNNNLYLFAHGGISMEFLNTPKNAFQILNNISWHSVFFKDQNVYNDEVDSDGINDLMGELYQSNLGNICTTKITQFNNLYLKYLNLVFNFFKTNTENDIKKHSSIPLIVLLSLSAPAETNPTIKDDKENVYKSNLSPIQTRLPIEAEIKNDKYGTSKYTNVYNFCGHASSGVGGYGFRSLSDGTICVNTDYASSLFKNNLMCEEETEETEQNKNQNYNSNNLMMTLKSNGYFFISGQISIPSEVIENFDDIFNRPKKEKEFTTIEYDDTEKLDFIDMEAKNTFFDKDSTKYLPQYTIFNGIGHINESNYYKIYSNYNIDKKTSYLCLKNFDYSNNNKTVVPNINNNVNVNTINPEQKFEITNGVNVGGGSYKKLKKSCKNKSCKKRNCKIHNTKKNKYNKNNNAQKKSHKNKKSHKHKN